MIELRRLLAFVAIAEEQHITRAAERLGVQQPSLTRLLQGLEAELGVGLVQRTPRGVRLTEAGAALLTEARLVLARADCLPDVVRRAARGGAWPTPDRLHQLGRVAPCRIRWPASVP